MPSRDPVSVLWDRGAAALLARAYAARGEWVMTRIADPRPAQAEYFAQMGIDVTGPDRATTISGQRKDMRTRWCRGFVRALYWHNKMGARRAIEIEIGARKPAVGRVPAGRAVRVRVRKGGSVAARAVARKPEGQRIYDAAGAPGGRWSDPSKRDWS